MLSERIKDALEVLAGEAAPGGTMRKQAEMYLGEEVDDDALRYVHETAKASYDDTLKRIQNRGVDRGQAHGIALMYTLLVGMALGKRLGLADGEEFARLIGEDVTDESGEANEHNA